MVTISAAVMGIEFAYAAETAFVSPTLLKIGVSQSHMTLIWCLSPLVGFFLTPILGSLSDRCKSALGRRRPFIILLSIGVVLGLLLVPNGKDLGKLMGDKYYDKVRNIITLLSQILNLIFSYFTGCWWTDRQTFECWRWRWCWLLQQHHYWIWRWKLQHRWKFSAKRSL